MGIFIVCQNCNTRTLEGWVVSAGIQWTIRSLPRYAKKEKEKKGTHWKLKKMICLTFCLLGCCLLVVGKSKLGTGTVWPPKQWLVLIIYLGLSPFPVNSHHQEEFPTFVGDRRSQPKHLNLPLFLGRVTNPTFLKLKRPLKLMCFFQRFFSDSEWMKVGHTLLSNIPVDACQAI